MEHSPGSFCLNLHGDYLCQHTGACCTAGWDIAIEPQVHATVAAHFGPRFRGESLVQDPSASSALRILTVRSDAACVFFEGDRGRLCAIHRELGVDALPSACRHFPRVVLQDPRGTLIALSHFCPTAAALLRSPAPPAIVAAPGALSLDDTAEGLDAREALPPLLRPGMLTDPAGYAAWERRSIGVLAREDLTPGEALATIEVVTRAVTEWRPGHGPLRDSVERAFDRPGDVRRENDDPRADERRAALVLASVPAGVKRPEAFTGFCDVWKELSQTMAQFDRSVSAYLAARLFGNWMAYHGGTGLLAIVEYLRVCLSVLKIEAARHSACSSVSTPWQTVIEPAIRSADLLLVHLSDTSSLARRLG